MKEKSLAPMPKGTGTAAPWPYETWEKKWEAAKRRPTEKDAINEFYKTHEEFMEDVFGGVL